MKTTHKAPSLSNTHFFGGFLVIILLSGCAGAPAIFGTPIVEATATILNPVTASHTPTVTDAPLPQPTGENTPIFTETPGTPDESRLESSTPIGSSHAISVSSTPQPTLAPGEWMTLPVIPSVSDTARMIYARGLELGRDPHAFSKIGDCQVSTDRFLVAFDQAGTYDLGKYPELQETIDWFRGSFAWNSQAARDAMRAEALFSPLYADPKVCLPGEGPLACEYRLRNPVIAIISLEQTWTPNIDLEKYAHYMRQAIETTISLGIVPILATKADNLEGNHQINSIIADLAWEYEIPLWNFWAAVQSLPNHGLVSQTPSGEVDLYHLTAGNNYDFSVPDSQRTGWTMRNLTALQALDAVWRGLTNR